MVRAGAFAGCDRGLVKDSTGSVSDLSLGSERDPRDAGRSRSPYCTNVTREVSMALIETLETVDVEDAPPVLNLQHLAPEVRAEIERFQREIERLEAGELEADDFKKFRLTNGVYGIRGSQDL